MQEMFCGGGGLSLAPLNHTNHLFSLALFIHLMVNFQGPGTLLGEGNAKLKMGKALSLPSGKAERGTDTMMVMLSVLALAWDAYLTTWAYQNQFPGGGDMS